MADNLTTQNLPVSPPARPPEWATPAPPEPPRQPHAQALTYSTPGAGKRPGVLTAIGVLSIVIACFSIVATLMMALQMAGFYYLAAFAPGATAPVPAALPAPTVVMPATGPTTAPTAPATTLPTTAPAPGGAALTPAEVQTVIQKVQAASSNGLNPSQVAALQTALQDPAQGLVRPGTAWSPVVSVDVDGGAASVELSGGWIDLDPQGKVVGQFTDTNPLSGWKLPVAALVLVGVDAVASLLLALLLLVAGILVFRRSALSARLHRIYAWLKIPTAVAGGIGLGWLFGAFVGAVSAPARAGSPADTGVFWTLGVSAAILGCAYPVGLLLALRSQRVRSYYNSISAG